MLFSAARITAKQQASEQQVPEGDACVADTLCASLGAAEQTPLSYEGQKNEQEEKARSTARQETRTGPSQSDHDHLHAALAHHVLGYWLLLRVRHVAHE